MADTDLPSAGTLILRELAAIAYNPDELQRVFRKAAAMGPTPEASAESFVESLRIMARFRILTRVEFMNRAKPRARAK